MTIRYALAETIGATFNIIDCIEKIDRGTDNLYIVDDNGNYTGRALTATNMRKLWKNDFSCIVEIPAIPYETIEAKAEECFRQFTQFTGFPVVEGQKIIGSVSNTEPNVGKYKWDSVTDPFTLEVKPFVDESVRVYVSSLEHEDIYGFYCKFANRLHITPISLDNIADVISGDSGDFLIYGVDIFPDIPKISIHDLWRECCEKTIRRNSEMVRIYKEIATVKEKDSMGLATYVRHFDNGHHTVAIVDENGNFKSVATLSTMRSNFPRKIFPKWTNLYLEYTPDQEALKYAVSQACFGMARRELPIVQNGKVVATGLLENHGERININGDANNGLVEIKWEIISDDVAKTILHNRKRILLSSTNGFLHGFVERFGELFDIEVFDDSLLNKYLDGEYDLLVYGADVWNKAIMPKYSAVKLYSDMLAEEVRRYLVNNNVSYYFAKIADAPKNFDQRLKFRKQISIPGKLGGEYFNYHLLSDMNTEECNVVDGNRLTTDQPKEYEYKVYFFGPCTVMGLFVADADTIPSKFQRIMNQNNCMGRAVNCGQGFLLQYAEINELYRMMDMNFKEGDIVVHCGNQGWESLPNGNVDWVFGLKGFYDTYCHQYDKIFIDFPTHLHAEGNQIAAEGLFEKLKDKLSKPRTINRKNVPAMFKKLIYTNILPPPEKIQIWKSIYQKYQKSA